MNARRLTASLFIAGMAAVALVAALGIDAPRLIGQLASGACTVGLQGAAVSMTIDGPGAQAECSSYLGQTTNGGSWYVYQGGVQPAGAVICQATLLGRLHTVRDQGISNVYGSGLCRNMMNPPTVAPTPAAISNGCWLGIDGHDVEAEVSDGACSAFAMQVADPYPGEAWIQGTPRGASLRWICSAVTQGYTVNMWDDGGADYAGAACKSLDSLGAVTRP